MGRRGCSSRQGRSRPAAVPATAARAGAGCRLARSMSMVRRYRHCRSEAQAVEAAAVPSGQAILARSQPNLRDSPEMCCWGRRLRVVDSARAEPCPLSIADSGLAAVPVAVPHHFAVASRDGIPPVAVAVRDAPPPAPPTLDGLRTAREFRPVVVPSSRLL